ncbi:Uncharacterised protein [Clostridium sporogenes]|nr:Uncharacterised protein [Clostridium sporogenes]
MRFVVVADAAEQPAVALRAAFAVEKLSVQDREEPAAQRRVVATARPARQRALERRLDEIVGRVDVARQPEREASQPGDEFAQCFVVEGVGGHGRAGCRKGRGCRVGRRPASIIPSSIRKNFSWNKAARAASYARSTMI